MSLASAGINRDNNTNPYLWVMWCCRHNDNDAGFCFIIVKSAICSSLLLLESTWCSLPPTQNRTNNLRDVAQQFIFSWLESWSGREIKVRRRQLCKLRRGIFLHRYTKVDGETLVECKKRYWRWMNSAALRVMISDGWIRKRSRLMEKRVLEVVT